MSGNHAAHLGEQAKKRRQERRLTQDEVADLAKVSRNTVIKFEKGRPVFDALAQAILHALEIETKTPTLYDAQPEYIKAFVDMLILYLEPMSPAQQQEEVYALTRWIYSRRPGATAE